MNKMRFGALCVLLFCITMPYVMYGQNEDYEFPVVYVDSPVNKSNLNNELFALFSAKTKEGISASKRITMIDATTEQALQLEGNRRDSGSAIDEKTLFNRLTTAGADYIVKAELTSGNCERIFPEKSTDQVGKYLDLLTGTDPYYKARLTWNITVISVQDGKVVANLTREVEGRSYKKEDKEMVAYANAMNNISSQARNTIDGVVVLSGTILKIESLKKNKAKTVIIDLGSQKGISKDDNAIVYAEIDIAGEKASRKIGRLSIVEVLSPNRSLANVKEGDKAIYDAFNNGQTLKVEVY